MFWLTSWSAVPSRNAAAMRSYSASVRAAASLAS